MECSAEHICHLHLLIESVTKKCDGQTDAHTHEVYLLGYFVSNFPQVGYSFRKYSPFTE